MLRISAFWPWVAFLVAAAFRLLGQLPVRIVVEEVCAEASARKKHCTCLSHCIACALACLGARPGIRPPAWIYHCAVRFAGYAVSFPAAYVLYIYIHMGESH